MLRITVHDNPRSLTFQLEGSLTGPRALAETVEESARRRPPAACSLAFEVWRQNLLWNSTKSASSIAQASGIEGSLLALELDLYRAVRLVARRRSRVSESE